MFGSVLIMSNLADDLTKSLSSIVSGAGDVTTTGFQTIDQVVGEGLEVSPQQVLP